MAVQARGEVKFVVAMRSKSLLGELVGQYACFRKFIHAHIYFEIDIIVVENVTQVLFFDDLIR